MTLFCTRVLFHKRCLYLVDVVCRARVAARETLFGGILINSPPTLILAWQRLKQQNRLELHDPNCISRGEGGANFFHISEIMLNCPKGVYHEPADPALWAQIIKNLQLGQLISRCFSMPPIILIKLTFNCANDCVQVSHGTQALVSTDQSLLQSWY